MQNPRHPGRTTGGSSGGNAAALAAGLCDIGIGTDTGCSIRLPASCCGVVGLKPSWGRIPVDGVFPLCPSFDTVGPMATTVAEVATMWSVLAQAPLPEPRLAGLPVGLLTRPPSVGGPALPENRAAEAYVEQLEALGARVVEASIPEPPDDTWPLFFHEAAHAHRATFPARADEYGENVRAKLELAQDARSGRGRARARVGPRAGAGSGRTSTSTSHRCSASTCRRSTATSSTSASRRRRSCARSTCSAGRRSRSATSS